VAIVPNRLVRRSFGSLRGWRSSGGGARLQVRAIRYLSFRPPSDWPAQQTIITDFAAVNSIHDPKPCFARVP
jgi:hypothetical protein